MFRWISEVPEYIFPAMESLRFLSIGNSVVYP
jgi:hypothetical protein